MGYFTFFLFFCPKASKPSCILHFQHISIWINHIQVLDGHMWQVAIVLDSDGLDKTAQTLLSTSIL